MAQEELKKTGTDAFFTINHMRVVLQETDHAIAELTVMPDGEHWFHTEWQMQFLDQWIVT